MIRRAEHSADRKFTLISRELAQDDRLSFQARGLLLYILSKPSNWKARYEDLRQQGGIGRTALDNIVNELRKTGYAVRRRERQDDGKLEWVMEIFEQPQTADQCTSTSSGTSARPPHTGKRALAIDSTRACAGSSVDLTRIKEKEPLYSIQELKEPDTIPGLRNQMAVYEHVPYDDAYKGWYAKNEPRGGIGRRPGSKCTLAQYATHIESYFATWQRNSTSNGNGHNGHGVVVDDQPMKTLKERLNIQ